MCLKFFPNFKVNPKPKSSCLQDAFSSTEAINRLQGVILYSSPGEGIRLEYPIIKNFYTIIIFCWRADLVQWWELSHWVTRSRVRSSLSADFAGGRLTSVFPFPRPHSCGSLRHWVYPCPLLYFAAIFILRFIWFQIISEISSLRLVHVCSVSLCHFNSWEIGIASCTLPLTIIVRVTIVSD